MNEQYALKLIQEVAEDQEKKILRLENAQLTSLPLLPNHIKNLWLEKAQITSLPPLPNHIDTLWIEKCKMITELPELPPNLRDFSCCGTPVNTLPSLPSRLHRLSCEDTEVEYLPDLPPSLYLLNADNSKLAVLTELPESLVHLWCKNTNITEYPPLPRRLETFDCSNTRITKLPVLSEKIRHLRIYKTPLRELPEQFPDSLRFLHSYETLMPDKFENEMPNEYLARVKKFQGFIEGLKPVLEERECRKRVISRCKAVKEDLMAATWHTDRVLDWCDPHAFDWED